MIRTRKVTKNVYDMECDECGEVLVLGEDSAVAATSIAFMQHGWDSWSYVEKGKRLNLEGASSCRHLCKKCWRKTWK